MKLETLTRIVLVMLVVGLAVVLAAWWGSEGNVAQADGGSAAGNWILVTSTIQNGESLLYMFNAETETLLVYAYYRRSGTTRGSSRYRGDLEFLAGRHCKWDALYSRVRPYPYVLKNESPPKGIHMPAELKEAHAKVSE